MASAKFLEEALSTDVDESAVNAIVGSLETQLVTSTPSGPGQTLQQNIVLQNHVNSSISNGGENASIKHGVANGGTDNVVLNSDHIKTNSGDNIVSANAINTIRSATPTGVYASQLSSVGLVPSNISNINKSHDGKVTYSTNQTNPVNLPNGSVEETSNCNQTSTTSAQVVSSNVTNVNKSSENRAMDQSKPTGTAVVIKSLSNSSQVPPIAAMTLATPNTVGATTTSGVPSIVTLAKPINQSVGNQQTPNIIGGSSQILPANVQILNMNAIRQGSPAQPGTKAVPQRVVIGGPQVIGNRPVQPGQITLQAFPSLTPGTQGHLLLKTENGQFQLLRVGPAPPTTQQTPTQTPFRVVPQGTTATTGVHQGQVQVATAASQNTTTTAGSGAASVASKAAVDQTKEKCRKFLANLLDLSSREPQTVERNVRMLIQELVNAKVEPEEFCKKLEKLLNASPQPCLVGFLQKSLPMLRQSMINKELTIDGINPPPPSVLFSNVTTTSTQPIQVRGVQMAAAPQMRVLTQPGSLRPGQQVQHRIITMASQMVNSKNVRVATPTVVRTPSGPITLRPGSVKTQFSTRSVLTNSFPSSTVSNLQQQKPQHPAKKFSGGVYTGDDDINDVAAMGGVNLAEESQKILGTTEVVGSQPRSCKDELFLFSAPLAQKIAKIVAKHNLDEPSSDVAALISHATQERLKTLVEKLAVIAEHRIDLNKFDPRYDVTQDVRSQLKCLEEIDKAERKRHEEHERELLLKAAKSRIRPEDPEQAKLRAKARELQRAEMEEVRQKEANITALLAIGHRKKPKLDDTIGSSLERCNSPNKTFVAARPRVKRVTMKDMLFLLEQEPDTRHSQVLFKASFK